MATIVYLDVDDEITSAAARIRTTEETRVALVVPYGSRLATSRINFRLLAREAMTRGRRLAIVAGDAATRALAASAGLPVFGSVGEYEAADAEGIAEAAPVAQRGREATPAAARETEQADQPATPPTRETPPDPDATVVMATPVATPVAAEPRPARPPAAVVPAAEPARPSQPRPSSAIPVIRSRRRLPFGRTAAIVAAGVLAFVVVVGGVAGYLLLPSATVSVVAKPQRLGPIELTVVADPAITEVDIAAGIVPSERLTFDLTANDTFAASGTRVETARASGTVTFQSFNTGGSNTIPGGSIVSTEGGIGFRTEAAIELPPAELIIGIPVRVVPSERSVGVTAVPDGTTGNVPANAITVIPEGEDPNLTKVNNTAATSGGRRQEFPVVVPADVDAAVEQLTQQLGTDFEARVTDPASVPEGKTLFPETASLADPEPTVAVESLLGTEVASFDLGMTASGSVIAVDESPLEEIARTRIRGRVEADHRLVDDSIEIGPPETTVEGEIVRFRLSAEASQVRILDAAELRTLVKGKPIAEARALLSPFGEVDIDVWPEWVTTIPTIDARFQLTVDTDTQPAPAGSPSPRPSARPSAAPSASAVGSPAP